MNPAWARRLRVEGEAAYERLAAWRFSISKQKMMLELMDRIPDCDTKAIFKHLDDEIIHRLNRMYVNV